jgi:hypothetical protein
MALTGSLGIYGAHNLGKTFSFLGQEQKLLSLLLRMASCLHSLLSRSWTVPLDSTGKPGGR